MKRSKSRSVFQDLFPSRIRSEMEKLGGEVRLRLGEGLKPGKDGIQGEFQTFRAESEEATQQAFQVIISLFFKIPFQSQESEGLIETGSRSVFLKYLAIRDWIQREYALLRIDQPSLAKRTLLRNSIRLKPRPPKHLGAQILFYPTRERQCFFFMGITPPEFPKRGVNVEPYCLGEEEQGHSVNRGGICHKLDESGSSSLGE